MSNFNFAITLLATLAASAVHALPPQPSGSWQELGRLNIGRTGCKAHAVDGHRVIALSGSGDEFGSADSSAEILDVSTGAWTTTALMPAQFMPGAASWTAKLAGGYFLVAGGFNPFLSTGDLRSFVYSVSSNTWTQVGDLPVGSPVVSNLSQTNAVVLDDGRVLIATGLAIGIGEARASVVFRPNYKNLDNRIPGPASGAWDFTRDVQGGITYPNGASEHHKLIKIKDGRVLLIHGNDRKFDSARYGSVYRDTHGVQAELFDPLSGMWTALPNLPAIPGEDDRHGGVKGVRQQAAVSLLNDGRVLVSGGLSSPADGRGNPLLKEIYYVRASAVLFDPKRFDAGENPWSITGPLRTAREAHVMGQLPGAAGTIAAWGWTRLGWTATAEIYDPATGQWKAAASLPAIAGTDIAVSLPWGCSASMPSGELILVGGVEDAELAGTSRRTFIFRP